MLPSLCSPMVVNQSVSRFQRQSSGGQPARRRFRLGIGAASWQHRCLGCGTLIPSGRCGRGFRPHRQRAAAGHHEGGAAGGAVAGRSRQWQAPAR